MEMVGLLRPYFLQAEPDGLSRPAFLVYVSSTLANVTGDSTSYTVLFDTTVKDIGTNYAAGTGKFTAPIAGQYALAAGLMLDDIAIAHTDAYISIVTSNRTYRPMRLNPFPIIGGGGFLGMQAVVNCADMDVGDTAHVTILVDGGTKVVDVVGSATLWSYFSGHLLP